MEQGSLGREAMAEGTCGFTVVSPLSVFVALRGPPLKLDEASHPMKHPMDFVGYFLEFGVATDASV